MKQVLQDLRSGAIEVAEVPAPGVAGGQLLIRTRASLVSSGSERIIVEFGQASLVAKARKEPERVRQVLDKIRTDGLLPTLEAVFARLDQPLPLGYCNVGTVIDVGPGVEGFVKGDRVASNGPHAEIVAVPKNLCARVPSGVSDEEAAFTVVGAVALEGVRLMQPALGESVAVIGLGLVGLLAAQLLRANGCRVFGVDPDPGRRDLAGRLGIDVYDAPPAGGDPIAGALAFSRGHGLDAVLITASAKTADLIGQAAGMSRKRGRIVLTGVVGMEIDRRQFYEKELSFQVSCSYGPGRYERDYEERGIDYPFPYVRWTAQRNFEAVLDLLASRRLNTGLLVGHRVPLAGAGDVYERLTGPGGAAAPGILLTYAAEVPDPARHVILAQRETPGRGGPVSVGVIGAGQFARMILLPVLRRTGAEFASIASATGLSARHLGRKYGFRSATSDLESILRDPQINTVFILTRHDSHAPLAAAALASGKHVFVEKPLALSAEDLAKVEQARREHPSPLLLVGFNRAFAPLSRTMRQFLQKRHGPASLITTVNAGPLSPGHWALDPRIGGGRIIGEACHWLDLMVFLLDARVVSVSAVAAERRGSRQQGDPSVTICLSFADGSTGTLHYLTAGHRSYPKERVEAFFDGSVLALRNFVALEAFGVKGFRGTRNWRQDKGHRDEVEAFVTSVASGGESPIPFERLSHVTRVALAAVESLRSGSPVALPAGDAWSPSAAVKTPMGVPRS